MKDKKKTLYPFNINVVSLSLLTFTLKFSQSRD